MSDVISAPAQPFAQRIAPTIRDITPIRRVQQPVRPSLDGVRPMADRRLPQAVDGASVQPTSPEAVLQTVSETTPLKRRVQLLEAVRLTLVAVILSITAVLAVQTWQTNQLVQAQAAFPSEAVHDNSGEQPAATTAATTTSPAPSEKPITPEAKSSYQVAGDLPRLLTINKLNVSARVLRMGVLSNGELSTPSNTNDVGWYSGSVRPGDKGAVLLDGHYSGPTAHGVFHDLQRLSVGDTLKLERGDGAVFHYTVRAVETVDVAAVDMAKVLAVYGGAEEGLNMITCGGNYNTTTQQFAKRTIVYTVRTS